MMPGQPSEPLSFVEIMPGSIITVQGNVQKSGRVEVLYNGQIFGSFMRDIAGRAELVEDETTGALVWEMKAIESYRASSSDSSQVNVIFASIAS